MGRIMEANEGFVCEIDGERLIVNKGSTRVDENHKLVKAYPQWFRPVDEHLSFETEAATANPGEARNRPSRASKQREATASQGD